jgi:hypothetical protein
MKKIYIQHCYFYGWDDAGWRQGDPNTPSLFDSIIEANEAIDDFIAEQHAAVAEGNMDECYNRDDYRAAVYFE